MPRRAPVRLGASYGAAVRGRRVSIVELALTLPAGSGRALSHKQFLAAAAACPGLARVRSHHAANCLEWARVVARLGSWTYRDPDPRATSRPTRARVCKLAGFSPATFKRCRRFWEREGFVVTVRQGRTAEARQMSRKPYPEYPDNDAAVYGLCVPRQRAPSSAPAPGQTEPPKALVGTGGTPHARGELGTTPDSQDQEGTGLRPGSFPSAMPRQLAEHAVLQDLSEKAVLSLWRPFQARGWSWSDWLYALNWRPDGRQHRFDHARVRRAAGWAKWRLSFWLDDAAAPILSRSQRAAVRRHAEAVERAATRLPGAAGRRPGTGPGPDYLAAREDLKKAGAWRPAVA